MTEKPECEVYWVSLGGDAIVRWSRVIMHAHGHRRDKAGLFQGCQLMKGLKGKDMPVCPGQRSPLCAQ